MTAMGLRKTLTGDVLAVTLVVCLALSNHAAASQADNQLTLADNLRHRRTAQDYVVATCSMETNPSLSNDLKAVNNIQGTVTFTQLKSGGALDVSVILSGLDPTGSVQHGFHVHQSGDITTNGCSSTGGHYNPFSKNHGAPTDNDRHVGDFGNVDRSLTGVVVKNFTDGVATLLGTYSIIGRAVVLHRDPDDLGRGNQADSLTTGHAGPRLACCVITQQP